jgi:hypothetical protein
MENVTQPTCKKCNAGKTFLNQNKILVTSSVLIMFIFIYGVVEIVKDIVSLF